MNIILCQFKSKKSIKKNLEKVISTIKNNKFDICIFPELFLTSYDFLYIKQLDNVEIHKSLKKIQELLKKKQYLITGAAINKYNAAVIITKKHINTYNKNTLTKKDRSYFREGKDNYTFNFKGHKIGLLICRDQNNLKLINKYKSMKCDILIQLSAHYYKYEKAMKKLHKNLALPITRAIDTNVLFIKVNTVGRLNKLKSFGNSVVVNKKGVLLRKANINYEEIIELNTKEIKW